MNKLTLILAGIVLILVLAIIFGIDQYFKLKSDRNRLSDNFEQVTQENSVLNTTVDELEYVKTKMVAKYDSVILENKIKPKQVKSATIIDSKYKDTTGEVLSANTKQDTARKVNNNPASYLQDMTNEELFIIPINTDNGCWGMKGEVITRDGDTKLRIIEKTFNNSHQLVVTKRKKFLFWTIKPEKYQLFNDCGEGTFTQINIVKR